MSTTHKGTGGGRRDNRGFSGGDEVFWLVALERHHRRYPFEEGAPADPLLINGSPLEDISILTI